MGDEPEADEDGGGRSALDLVNILNNLANFRIFFLRNLL